MKTRHGKTANGNARNANAWRLGWVGLAAGMLLLGTSTNVAGQEPDTPVPVLPEPAFLLAWADHTLGHWDIQIEGGDGGKGCGSGGCPPPPSTKRGCFDWQGTGGGDKCSSGSGSTQRWTSVGVYYCPAVNQPGTGCHDPGGPTTGTVDVGAYWSGSLAAKWCVQFSGGAATDTCQLQPYESYATSAKGGSVFGNSCCQGTYGGFFTW